MNVIKKTVELPDGRTISIETGKLAKQADGAVMLTMGNTMLLATVCAAKDAVPGTDFMPLQVEYREKFAAAGRFPGGFTKREGKASDYEILTCRLVDRALRPLFPSNYHAEVYVNVILYSADGVDMPDALADKPHAKAYFGAMRLVLGDEAFASLSGDVTDKLVQQAIAMDTVVRDAVAENSLNPQNIEAAIRKGLLPLLFGTLGLDNAKLVVEQVIQITRVGLSKS